MATTLTRNLKLRIDSNLTANSKYNLERIDNLGATFLVDSTDTLNIRSVTDIAIEPESPDIGGSGVGGTLTIGTPDHSISSVTVYSDTFNLQTQLGLLDQASGGTKYGHIRYKSDVTGSVDTSADRTLSLDLSGADRNLVLGGDLLSLGGSLTLNLTGTTSLILPQTGTLSTLNGVETLTNKTLSGLSNTITNLRNQPSLGFLNSGFTTTLLPAQSGQVADIDFQLPPNEGVSGQVLVTDGAGATSWTSVAGSGTVTSVGLTAPAELNVSGSPITASGTLGLTWANQSANTLLAGPTAGSATTPAYRLLVKADLPAITTDDVPEGATNQYFTAGRISGKANVALDNLTVSGLASQSLLVASSSSAVSNLSIGSNGNILTVVGGNATWQAPVPTVASSKSNWITADGTTKAITHSLGTLDVIVQLYDKTDGATIEIDTVVRTNTNTVTLTASQAPGAAGWRVLVLAT